MGEGKSDLALPLSDLEDYGRRLRSLKKRMNHTGVMRAHPVRPSSRRASAGWLR